jgi:hypothetical protein
MKPEATKKDKTCSAVPVLGKTTCRHCLSYGDVTPAIGFKPTNILGFIDLPAYPT